MFGNGIPDTLPTGYGDDVQVESFTQTPQEIRAAEKFIKSADGVIVPPGRGGPNPELKRVPASEDFISFPRQHPGTPWAPQPPYNTESIRQGLDIIDCFLDRLFGDFVILAGLVLSPYGHGALGHNV